MSDYVKKINSKEIAASEVVPGSSLETAVNGKLNVDGSNATQVGTSAIVKTLGNGSDDLWNGDRFPANGHANQGTNPDDFTLRSTDNLLNFLFRNGLGGFNYADLDTSMKRFGHAYGAIIGSDTGCYGWKIGETSHTGGYSSAAFKAIVVVWEFDAPNWDHDGYSGRNFVGVLDITHRITEGTISDSADKKIGTLTCICPMYCENSNGNRGYTVFVKQAADTHIAEWYIGRNTASANMNSKIQYGRISIFPIMEYRWKKFMVQQDSAISFNSDKDEYWGNRNVPFFSYANYSGVGSTTRPVYVKANGELAPTTGLSADHVPYEHTNEINFTNVPTTGNKDRHWFNYRNADTDQADSNNLLTDYYFGNRNNSTNGVYLHADGFAPRIITGGNDNVLPFVKFNMTNTGTAKGFIHFKCVFMGTNDNDGMGQVDITIKIRQNEWHAVGLKCVRNGGAGSLNYGDTGNYVYWSNGTTVYIGVRPSSWGAKLCVFVQYCELNGTATYTLGNYLSEVSGLTIHEGDNRDVSIPKISSQAYNVRSINIENYLQIEIQRGNNHRHASITIFGDNGSYPFIANIGFQYLTSPTSGESAGFQTPPVLSMVESNNNASNAYVPNVWYINNGSSGSSYIYCKWSSNKRLNVLLNTFDPKAIILSDVSSLPSGAVAASTGHSTPHMSVMGTAVGNTTTPVYVTDGGQISSCSEMLKKDASNVAASTDGTGAGANICGSLKEGASDITSNQVYFITTDSSGTSDGKWYKRTLEHVVAYLKGDADLRKGIVRTSKGSSSQPIYVDSSGYTQPCNMTSLTTAINGSGVGGEGSDPTPAADGQAHPVFITANGKPSACCYTSRGGAVLNYRMTCPVKWTPQAGNLNGVQINKNSYTRLTNGIYNLDSAYFPQNITSLHTGLPVMIDVALWIQNATSGTDVTAITIGLTQKNSDFIIGERTFQIVAGYDGYLYATFLSATIDAINASTPFDIWIKSNGTASNTARAKVFAYSIQGMIVL